ncbi:hypothetical protein [uncultured Brevundimonas sp.]|uniref:hypothetical protein n=1 Tax=uncultured Brevundimonas sp. TaxID=213418 RepID=UPI0030ECF1EF|tara:strand:- start:133 stop:651 length:519 start_codon:yes stop_codon:yes gene_type:complete
MSKFTLNESAIQHVTCGRCGTAYDYDQTATAEVEDLSLSGKDRSSGDQRALAQAQLDRIFDRGLIVPCPKCKAVTPTMRKQLMRVALRDLAFMGGALLVALGVMLAALESGALAWGLGILALLAAAVFAIRLLCLPFGSYNDDAKGRLAGTPSPAGSGDVFESLRFPGSPGE